MCHFRQVHQRHLRHNLESNFASHQTSDGAPQQVRSPYPALQSKCYSKRHGRAQLKIITQQQQTAQHVSRSMWSRMQLCSIWFTVGRVCVFMWVCVQYSFWRSGGAMLLHERLVWLLCLTRRSAQHASLQDCPPEV